MNDDQTFPIAEIDDATALLIRARGFIEHGWCRYTQAQDANNEPVGPHSERAASWCAYGALVAAGMSSGSVTHAAFVRLATAIGGDVVPFNNAQETVEPLLIAFDKAIAAGS